MMLPIEKEMIGLMLKGASTPLDNIRVSAFLLAWSASLLAIVRTAQHEREAQIGTKTKDPENLGRMDTRPEAGEGQSTSDEKGGNTHLIQPAKRSH